MRSDMNKVIREGYRHKGEEDYRRRRRKLKRELTDDSPQTESMKRWAKEHHKDGKQSRIKFGIIKKFLQSSVGKHWDDVYSEIRQVFRGKPGEEYLIEIFKKDIEQNTFLHEGKIRFNPKWVWAFSENGKPIEECYDDFFVHPVTGLLTKTPKKNRKYRQSKRGYTFIKVNEHEQIHLIHGIWYRITFEQRATDDTLQMYPIAQQIKNSWGKREFGWWETTLKQLFGGFLMPVRKRQLNSKDLKKYKIRNEK